MKRRLEGFPKGREISNMTPGTSTILVWYSEEIIEFHNEKDEKAKKERVISSGTGSIN